MRSPAKGPAGEGSVLGDARIDPGFGAASDRNRQARSLSTGTRQSPRAIELGLERSGEMRQTGSNGRGNAVADAARAAADDVNPSSAGSATAPGKSGEHGPPEKDHVSAATKTDKPGKSGRVTIVITRPRTQ